MLILLLSQLGCHSSSTHPSAHDPARLIQENNLIIAYYSGLESVYYSQTEQQWQLGLGHNDDAPFSGENIQTWLEDSPVAGIEPNTAPAMLDAKTMYYCKADWERDDGSACIGRATATGTHPTAVDWNDDGQPVVCSTKDDVQDGAPFAIDPAVIESDGRLWLAYGSHYSGIWLTELNPTTGHLLDPEGWTPDTQTFHQLANYPDSEEENYIESPFLYEHEGYFYLFVNWDQCCRGVDSTYNIRVGRSQSITGPYIDKAGIDMKEGGGTLFLDSEGRYIGPGHAGITDISGEGLVFSFHYYDKDNDGEGTLGIRALRFEDGWPVLGEQLFTPVP